MAPPIPARVLLIEDSDADASRILEEIAKSGEALETSRVRRWNEFTDEIARRAPNLIIANYQHEGFDGLAALEYAKDKVPDVPFIFVSYEVHDDTLIEMMKLGATDYVFKEQLSRLPLTIVRALREAREREALKTSQQRIIEQERIGALGKMASGITHDFSNALMPVLGFVELLINHPENLANKKKLARYLGLIHTSTKDAMEMVSRLRDFYRQRKEGETFHPVDLRQVVEEAVLLARPRWKDEALSRGAVIKVDTELPRTLPKISANASALREMMTNLIFNAIDAMPRGGTIRCHARVETDALLLEIGDSGEGMDEETRKHCFEPFFSTKGNRGTGMGLAMVYGIVRRHGGSIEVKSKKGEGTTFVIRLPFGDGKAAPKETGGIQAFRPERPLHVLVVDDEPLVRRVIKEYLSGDGHSVVTARDGAEALEKFAKSKFDVVFTDWAMPGMSGDQLALEIKKHPANTPIVMLTGFAEKVEAASIDHILSKPATLSSVREALWRVIP